MMGGVSLARDRRYWTGWTVAVIVLIAGLRLWVEATRGLPL